MADPVADNADLAVDELKRKARRRLVGAIVLALAAATILPLLLEHEQKPLGDDVSVQIPPVDRGRFVSRLKEATGTDAMPDARPDAGAIKAAGSGPAAALPAPAPVAPVPVPAGRAPAEVSAAAEAASRPPLRAGTDANAAAADAKAAAPSVKTAAADAGAGNRDALKPSLPAAPPAAAGEASAGEGYVVQLGAFTDKYGANALANKLKKIGYPAYTEPVETSRGTLWRVRVGGYATRQAAAAARSRLRADGQDGVVTAAK